MHELNLSQPRLATNSIENGYNRGRKNLATRVLALSMGGIAAIGLVSCSSSEIPKSRLGTIKEIVPSSDGVKLRVESKGNQQAQEVIIGVHGGPGLNLESLKSLNQFAGPNRRLVLYDQRGSGDSTKPNNNDYSLASQVDDLEAVRQSTHTDKVDLVGESWGGLLAAAYTSKYPEHVDGLVLLDAIPLDSKAFIAGEELFHKRTVELQSKGIIANILPGVRNGSCMANLNALMPVYVANPEGRTPKESGTCTAAISEATFKDITRPGVLDTYAKGLKNFHGRALVIEGEKDPFGLDWLHRNVELLGSAVTTQLVVKDAGHFPIFEQPKSVVPELNAFLR